MNFSDCTTFACNNPTCSIATVEGDQPRVRMFAMWYADETGFYFHSFAPKAVCQQIKLNPKIEICFHEPAPSPIRGKTMRVTGQAEFLDDVGIRTKLLEERPLFKEIGIDKPEHPILAIFRIRHGEAWFWTIETNTQEPDKIRF